MILISIAVLVFIIGLNFIILGKILKKKKILITGICIFLLLTLSIFLFIIYAVEKENMLAESQRIGQVDDNTTLPMPDRIIYKNANQKYTIMDADTSVFSTIYSELYSRLTSTYDGKVFSEDEISQMQDRGSFIEFDYNTKSKNFVFLLEEDGIGVIKRFSDSGQVIKNSLDRVEDLIKTMNRLTQEMTKYEFNKNQNYTSTIKLVDFPQELNFTQKRDGIYQKIIQSDDKDYQDTLKKLDFKIEENLPQVDFAKQNVIITISIYEIEKVTQNIGNVKYEFGNLQANYTVNLLIISKVVNSNCIYYNVSENATNTELSNITTITTSATIKSINENRMEIGLGNENSTYIVELQNNTLIKNYETGQEISITDLKVGDSIYVEGETDREINGLKSIKANRMEICSQQRVKNEIINYLKDTYRIDGMSIAYVGKDYIIVTANFDKFVYPLKLNINDETETFLGMNYHLQSNYGYVLHEMCDITLDTKITDVDNIRGFVKTIEYIAD